MLLPWRCTLDAAASMRTTLASATAMTIAFVAAAFGWFAPAVADYTGLHEAGAFALLLIAAPVLQPQVLAYAIALRLARGRAPLMRSTLAIAAWLAVEWAVPRAFGDTLGLGLQPSRWLRQGADIAGVGGLTLALLVVHEAFATAVARRRAGSTALAMPLAAAIAVPLLLVAYAAARLATLPAPSTPPARIGLVQAAIVDYERLRREHGSYAVVRQVLDTHEAMSRELRARGADAIVWPETVYPTTFGQPRSDVAADFDREITAFAASMHAPLVFGTYTRDAGGEYNAAAFVDPARGPLGIYRKTRLFPLTEYVPGWLDGPALRRWLPWAGSWRPGDGARVFPLVLPDGREIPVAPLICRDDVDPVLARDAARLGAQMLVGLSNDAWFTRAPLGARLHLASAAFRSIETRLPQVRATTNGMSASIDATGEIVAATRMGERAGVLATVHPGASVSPFVRVGVTPGPLAIIALVLFVIVELSRNVRWLRPLASRGEDVDAQRARTYDALLVRPWQRVAIGGLRAVACGSVLVLAVMALTTDDAPGMLTQLRMFAACVLAPELAAAALAHACRARLRIEPDRVVVEAAYRTVEIDRERVGDWRPWRLPWPRTGFDVVLRSGAHWTHSIAVRDASRVLSFLGATRFAPEPPSGRHASPPSRLAAMYDALSLPRSRFDNPLLKFALFPLLPAIPAFRLHQMIAYGSPFGELYTFGAKAYLTALLLWWGSWAVSLVLVAGGLRAAAEAAAALTLALRQDRAAAVRAAAMRTTRAVYYVGIPGWLVARILLS